MNLNLEDIAKLAGVSRSTVSRVINQHPHVKDKTRQRVLRVIQEQNYHPNLAARALVKQQTRMLSLVIPQAVASTFTDPYFPTLIQGVMARANERDYAVILWIGDNTEEENRFCQRVLNNNLFEGIVIASAVNDDPLVPRLAQAGYPFVLIGAPPLENINYIDVDNLRAAQVAVSHLIRLGRKRIGTITGPLNMGASRARLNGYRQALERAGLSIDDNLIMHGKYDEASGYMAMRALLLRKVDAVFAGSDIIALGALRAMREQGVRVPDDIALVGFDDLPLAATTTPALTTVRQPIRELGVLSTQMLIDLLEHVPEKPYQIILPAQLIVRDTCGATQL